MDCLKNVHINLLSSFRSIFVQILWKITFCKRQTGLPTNKFLLRIHWPGVQLIQGQVQSNLRILGLTGLDSELILVVIFLNLHG